MVRTQVLGIGSHVPDRIVRNDELRFLDDQHVARDVAQTDTSDEWIQTRSGIRERRYVPNDGSVTCSDLGLEAARNALADAGVEADAVDCIIFATLSPDIHFPGNAVFLQSKLGIHGSGSACYDIRQQCSGFVYGLQMADAFVRSGLYRRVLLVGSELHSHALDYSTRGRDVTVLFGDGAGAFLLGPGELDDPRDGILYTRCGADGSGAWNLHLKLFDMARLPYVNYDPSDRDQNAEMYPQMDGKKVFLHAVRRMAAATRLALEDTRLGWDEIDWFVPHQANLRINQKVCDVASIPEDKVLNTIEFYGNTTAATVPLTIDCWRQRGKVKKGDLVLSTVFGAGFTWGSAIFRV